METDLDRPPRLSTATVDRLPRQVVVPQYDSGVLGRSIVHLSVGNFHRAHQALYLDELLAGDGDQQWGICGVGLLPEDGAVAAALRPQDLLYTVVERDAGIESVRVIGAMRSYVHASSEPLAVLARLADPETRLVTLTVTEGGYFRSEATGELQRDHPWLVHDLERRDEPPVSVWGFLAEALDRRWRTGAAPFTVLSCDNLQRNGEVARSMLAAFAELRDSELARWIDRTVTFPSSMVDRITPATTGAHRAYVKELLGGVEDACPVVVEPFRQWVVEDSFCNGRPALDSVGALLTDDVHPYEQMKIRMLNGAHQALCHAGLLLGYRTSDAAMQDSLLRTFCERYMENVRPLLHEPVGIDLAGYQKALIRRFSNPEVKDQLVRIATDASSRIPAFVLPSLRDQLARAGSVDVFALVIAAWFRCLVGSDEAGRPFDVPDARKDTLLAAVSNGVPDATRLLGLHDVFGADLATNPVLIASVRATLGSILEKGWRPTASELLEPTNPTEPS